MRYVNYEITGFDGKFQAGPYTEDQVESEHRDIRSYAGIFNCYVAVDADATRKNPTAPQAPPQRFGDGTKETTCDQS